MSQALRCRTCCHVLAVDEGGAIRIRHKGREIVIVAGAGKVSITCENCGAAMDVVADDRREKMR